MSPMRVIHSVKLLAAHRRRGSGVKRDNQVEENGGMRMVVRSNVQTPCSDEAQPSTSQQDTTDAEAVSRTAV